MSQFWRLLPVCVCCCLFTACSVNVQGQVPRQASSAQQETQEAAPKPAETTFPGTYTVPEGWVKWETYSTANKIFYVEQGHENDKTPDNISINTDTNRYAAADHEQFRNAIVQQLAMQVKSVGAELGGTGTHTKQDYVDYIFTIREKDGPVTEQHYIIGEKRFCLIHATNYTGKETVSRAAKEMADSFVWANA